MKKIIFCFCFALAFSLNVEACPYSKMTELDSKLNSDNKLSDFSEPSNKDDDEDIPF